MPAMTIVFIAVLVTLCAAAGAWQQDRFIVTAWVPPPAEDATLAAFASEGYNLTWAPPDKLDLVHKHGLKALVQDSLLGRADLDDPAQVAKLDALIDRVKGHPAVEGYYITDEPGSGAFEELGRIVEHIRARDPKHLAYINLFPTYANYEQLGVSADAVERAKVGLPSNFAGEGVSQETVAAYKDHLDKYIAIVKPDLVSYDHYHFLKTGDGAQYFLNLEMIRDTAMQAGLPFLNIIQACDGEPTWRLPDKNEMRFLVFTTMAYGGRGISYFLYWGWERFGLYVAGVKTPLADVVAELNHEINAFGPALMKLDSTAVYHTKDLPFGTLLVPEDSPVQVDSDTPLVLGLFEEDGEADAFMIVNRDYRKSAVARIAFRDAITGLREYDRLSKSWKGYSAVRGESPVTVELKPGDGRLFRYAGN